MPEVLICENVQDMLDKFNAMRGEHEYLRLHNGDWYRLLRNTTGWQNVLPYGYIRDYLPDDVPYSRLRYWLVANINPGGCPDIPENMVAGIIFCKDWDYYAHMREAMVASETHGRYRHVSFETQRSVGYDTMRLLPGVEQWLAEDVATTEDTGRVGSTVTLAGGSSATIYGSAFLPQGTIYYVDEMPPHINLDSDYFARLRGESIANPSTTAGGTAEATREVGESQTIPARGPGRD